MKNKLLLFALLCVFPLFAGAQDTYDYSVSIDEGLSFVRYTGSLNVFPDTTGNHYTQAMFIGDLNQNTGMFQGICSNVPGTESVNVLLQVSNDRLNWVEIASPLRSALATTAVYDTVNVIQGVNRIEYRNSVWMRLKFDGQTGNPRTTISWSVYLPKNTAAPPRGVGAVANKR